MHPLTRFDFERITLWLTGHQQYQWLTIEQPDLHHVRFRCLCKELTPIYNGWIPYAFEGQFVCDCPYAYGFPYSKTFNAGSSSPVEFLNLSSTNEYYKPDLTIKPAGGTFSITNTSDNNRVFEFTGLPPGITIQVNNNDGIIQCSNNSYNLYPMFNMNFFRCVQGPNYLKFSGGGEVTISGMFLHNVGA